MKFFSTPTPKVTNAAPPAKRSLSTYHAERQIFRMHEDLARLKIAIDTAENLSQFNREELHRIYREVWKDPHLQSQWNTRKLKTIEKEFALVSDSDEPNDDATKLVETQWFLDLMDAILDAKLWGFTLIELGPVVNGVLGPKLVPFRASNGRMYDAINVIDRDYVKPEIGIVGYETSDITGMPFEGGPFDGTLIFVGKRHDFGLMLSAVKYVLFKDNCAGNWSEWAEIFGMDIRVGKTLGEGNDKKKFLETLKKLASAGYGVIDKEDEIEHFGTARNDAYKVYMELMETVDKNISKLIFGQDVVTNNTGRVVGQVGENISNLYGDSDAKFVARVINDEVLPRLTALGFPFKGLRFKWDNSEKLTLKDNAEIDYKISQMGYKPSKDYLEEKYSIKLEDLPEPEPAGAGELKTKTAAAMVNKMLKELYATAME